MRQIGWVLMGAWLVAATPCAAEPIEVESRIVAVTVFPDRASVTRVASLTLSEGTNTVKLAPLPSQVEPASVTAKGAGEVEVMLHGVQLVTTQLETAQDPTVKELEERIRDIVRDQRRLHNTKRVLADEREYLTSIQAASSEQIGKDLITRAPSASDAAALLEFLDGSLLKNFERDQNADIELEEYARELDKLRRELGRLTQGRHKWETAILVELEARTGGSFQLEVSYRVSGATWQPSYEARAATTADQVELVSYALVRQRTGEDWIDATLTLSTARPALAGSMPELQPWFLRPWEPVVADQVSRKMMKRQDLRGAGFAADEAFLEEERAPEAPRAMRERAEKSATMAQATVEVAGPSVTFRLPRPESIESNWQPHKVPIATHTLNAELAYETTPRLMSYAFLRAKVTNTTNTLYLPGRVAVFLDGAFVATASMKQVAPNEEFDLYLGVDERVRVERTRLKERVAVSLLPGLRGKTKSTEYEFLTTIENFTARRIEVTVFDQIPVSEREEIIVESVKQVPDELERDEEKPGVFSWTLDLIPKQKQELTLSYRVRHPVDMRIQ